MRVIEVKSCRECLYREKVLQTRFSRHCLHYDPTFWCRLAELRHGEPSRIDRRTKTFPKFCPLKEAKDG